MNEEKSIITSQFDLYLCKTRSPASAAPVKST